MEVKTMIKTLIAVGLIAGSAWNVYSYKTKSDALSTEISKLESTLNKTQLKLNNLNDANTEVAKNFEQDYKSASKAGNDVAALQNKYPTIDPTDKAVWNEHITKLGSYFAEDSKYAKAPWDGFPSNVVREWKFLTNYSFVGDSIPCVWECRDKKGVLLAYAMGNYDVKEHTFSQVGHDYTTQGMKIMGDQYDRPSGTAPAGSTEDFVKAVRSLVDKYKSNTANEKKNDNVNSNNKAKPQTSKSNKNDVVIGKPNNNGR